MQVIDNIFNQLIKSPLIGSEEKISITKNYNSLTSEFYKIRLCKEIEYNLCSNEFLKSINFATKN